MQKQNTEKPVTKMNWKGNKNAGSRLLMTGLSLAVCLLMFGVSACSESEDEQTSEFVNWQQRNEDYLASVVSRCNANTLGDGVLAWKKIKTYTKDEETEGAATDYVYAEVLEQGSGTVSPYYTDTVRIAYRGRLIPSATYADGYVFDQTYYGDFSWQTISISKGVASRFVDGFSTALMHMHAGDRWRVYIPYTLGYGASGYTASGTTVGIPGYSLLVFDLALTDFWHPGETGVAWTSRRR